MIKEFGQKVELPIDQIYSLFSPVEGMNAVYYGRVGNGKTYAATADILELLKRGEIVVCNWEIDFEGYDERNYFLVSLVKFLFRRDLFFKYNKDNLIYIHPDNVEKELPRIGRMGNVHIFLDEGQWIFNSHARGDDPEKRKLVLHGRHYCRSLNVITQRPMNIYKDIRSQVNVWYKCVKQFQLGSIIRFVRYSYEDMKDDMPDEENHSGVKAYWGKKRIFYAYNTHAMRDINSDMRISSYEAYLLSFSDRLRLLFSFFKVPAALKRRPAKDELNNKVSE